MRPDTASLALLMLQAAHDDDDPSHELMEQGAAYADEEGVNLLFKTNECLCLNQTDCEPEDSLYYPVTRAGLNRLMQEYLFVGE